MARFSMQQIFSVNIPHIPCVISKKMLGAVAGLLSVSLLAACNPSTPTADRSPQSPDLQGNPGQSTSLESTEPAVRFGILAIDSATSVHDRYNLLMEYLSESLGRPVELIILSQDSQFTEVETGNLDFISNNPLAAVQVQRLYATNFIATLDRPRTGTKFSGLIIAHRDSGIKSLNDIKGKKGACVDFETAAAGCLFQIYHLLQNQIDPFVDLASFVENPSQDGIVLGVLNRTIDIGFIRTGQLERMVRSGLLEDTQEIVILEPKRNNFYFEHTTDLYPEWPVAAIPSTDPNLVEAVREALLNAPKDHPALKAANLEGFKSGEDYEPIHNLIEALQVKSWDARAK